MSSPVKTYDVAADCAGPRRATVTVRDLAIEVDAPESSGGTNRGPNPVEYLLVSLAGCLNVTGSHVAREMGLDLVVRSVRVSGDLDARAFRTGEGERAGYERIRVSMAVETAANDEEIERWRRETERRNPVLDTIARPTPIEVEVAVE
jgi:uncharacterized OsmC-like protein